MDDNSDCRVFAQQLKLSSNIKDLCPNDKEIIKLKIGFFAQYLINMSSCLVFFNQIFCIVWVFTIFLFVANDFGWSCLKKLSRGTMGAI